LITVVSTFSDAETQQLGGTEKSYALSAPKHRRCTGRVALDSTRMLVNGEAEGLFIRGD
jgi:hypothetical protein